jgi:hypothetical protein
MLCAILAYHVEKDVASWTPSNLLGLGLAGACVPGMDSRCKNKNPPAEPAGRVLKAYRRD